MLTLRTVTDDEFGIDLPPHIEEELYEAISETMVQSKAPISLNYSAPQSGTQRIVGVYMILWVEEQNYG
jgi:hypothetical protein